MLEARAPMITASYVEFGALKLRKIVAVRLLIDFGGKRLEFRS